MGSAGAQVEQTSPGSARGPVPKWLGAMAEPVYRAAIARRNRGFDAGRGVTKVELPVVSVGNLSVGGTGKTPMVMHVVGLLLEAGMSPCVAMRGYRARKGRNAPPRLLIEQAREPAHSSDEADEYRRVFPELPIVAQPDRLGGIRALLDKPFQPKVDCVVLDDGFQHRKIARDLDVVLIDASRSPFADRLLPRGWLREPVESLARADAVVITHAELLDPPPGADPNEGAERAIAESGGGTSETLLELSNHITHAHGKPPTAVTAHVWTGLKLARSHAARFVPELLKDGRGRVFGDDVLLPLDELLGSAVTGVCAIGNPAGFVRALRRTLLGDRTNPGRLADLFVLPDHDAFDDAVVRSIVGAASANGSDWIVSTDKDWSKLRDRPAEGWPCAVIRPQLSLVFRMGREAFDRRVLTAVGVDPDDPMAPIKFVAPAEGDGEPMRA
ncbi:MAG: tetraacyldisaccharide 4'-kinase [Phycisphaeraceae bacterium]|nr:tetraacyldisaccharide 4'-kinase [Phycisphaeraceae bacterium]